MKYTVKTTPLTMRDILALQQVAKDPNNLQDRVELLAERIDMVETSDPMEMSDPYMSRYGVVCDMSLDEFLAAEQRMVHVISDYLRGRGAGLAEEAVPETPASVFGGEDEYYDPDETVGCSCVRCDPDEDCLVSDR